MALSGKSDKPVVSDCGKVDIDFVTLKERSLINGLFESGAFSRLRSVSFLGSVDFYNKHMSKDSTERFSRSDHTRGVLNITINLINRIEISELDRLTVIAAAVCHDMGHSPFSHSTENVYRRINPRINHKTILSHILDHDFYGVGSVLSESGVDPVRVYEISSSDRDPMSWIFHCPVNVDTLDGMMRFLATFKIAPPFDVHEAVLSLARLHKNEPLEEVSAVGNFDLFWSIKRGFYEEFLRHGRYARFEQAFECLVESMTSSVSYDDYLQDDKYLELKIGATIDSVNSFNNKKSDRSIVSEFKLNKSVRLNSIQNVYTRYVRERCR